MSHCNHSLWIHIYTLYVYMYARVFNSKWNKSLDVPDVIYEFGDRLWVTDSWPLDIYIALIHTHKHASTPTLYVQYECIHTSTCARINACWLHILLNMTRALMVTWLLSCEGERVEKGHQALERQSENNSAAICIIRSFKKFGIWGSRSRSTRKLRLEP